MDWASIDERYCKAKKLSEFTDDPETAPYKSKYEARALLRDIRDDIHKRREENIDDIMLLTKEAAIDYHLAINYIHTEEVSTGEEQLSHILQRFDDDTELKSEVVSIVIAANNELSLVWSSREDEVEKTHGYLTKAESLYLAYMKTTDDAPHTLDDHFLLKQANELERRNFLENLHTYTLFYLAQVYKSLEQADLSASYCMKTLRRQLQLGTYKPLEWSLNCACLSQYFIQNNMFRDGKHCLSCANHIMMEVDNDNAENESKINETFADIARCWVKYCLCLLEVSKNRCENNAGELGAPVMVDKDTKSCERFPLEVTHIEDNVPHDICNTYDGAKMVFLLGKRHANDALKHFVLDGFVTDHIELHQDISHLYQYVAFFELNVELRCRMFKRRIDLLISVLNELNPQFYLAICRQLQFELAEVYSEMMDMKISLQSNNEQQPSVHAWKKINSLCNSSIKYFHEFLNTLRTSGNKTFPERFDSDVERPALIAHFYIARLYSKLLTSSPEEKVSNLKLSFDYYSFITSYVQINEEAVNCVKIELEICKDMVDVLPKTMDRLISSNSCN